MKGAIEVDVRDHEAAGAGRGWTPATTASRSDDHKAYYPGASPIATPSYFCDEAAAGQAADSFRQSGSARTSFSLRWGRGRADRGQPDPGDVCGGR
ncbi:hypothetical protein [Streptomyces sp. NPDC127105]|uniref:hypothetical protein n=1 Tax=Streptomyces sp. NPDC127105 TaxID=3345359 RepID=UPI00366280EF